MTRRETRHADDCPEPHRGKGCVCRRKSRVIVDLSESQFALLLLALAYAAGKNPRADNGFEQLSFLLNNGKRDPRLELLCGEEGDYNPEGRPAPLVAPPDIALAQGQAAG